ncbi:hypothetical protein EG68_11997 [Paragonimus skrjabini miyazakii]|uniref:Uncharacterized protein n=1 Tax=Paragonimus skrjabini miyazakii TaxID=59628 RepID=A0A8S9YP16_9TREM|nr:hypothetical protein EG68_11997 [Paragonimus skrjabini miyazakii]
MKQTPSLRPSQGSSGTFWNDDIEDDDSKFRPNCSSQPNSVQKCGDGLNSQTSLYPSAVTRDRKHDHDNEPTGPPPVSKHSSAEISGLRKATGSASSSPETRNSSSSGEAEEEDNLNQKKKKNKRNSVKELLKRYERLTSKVCFKIRLSSLITQEFMYAYMYYCLFSINTYVNWQTCHTNTEMLIIKSSGERCERKRGKLSRQQNFTTRVDNPRTSLS